MLNEALIDWEMQPTLSVAADLVSVATSTGYSDLAKKAAQLILERSDAPPAIRSLAAICLGKEQYPNSSSSLDPLGSISEFSSGNFHCQIHRIKQQLFVYPHNPIVWTNLALFYTSLGQSRPGLRAIRVAMALAPADRFVLRSASRFFLHQGEGELAHEILVRAQTVRHDPWILAAEIATSSAIRKTSTLVKTAQKMIDSGSFSPVHTSELASALGTLDAFSGNLKRSRRLIRSSLEDASENAIAQAAWLSRAIIGVHVLEPGKTLSFEANAWDASQSARFREAVYQARRWQFDQPFSSRPAVLGSYTASTALEQHQEAVRFAQQGLLTNPDEFLLRNNLAFSLAHIDKVAEAKQIIAKVDEHSLNGRQRIIFTATRGLIAFRAGQPELGRTFYDLAVQLAVDAKEPLEIPARIYYALEELRHRAPIAEQLRQKALRSYGDNPRAEFGVLIERLKKIG
jgi:Flp pilus assembly protein TadD